jgi:alpha-1,2-mannosyltransferase
MSTRRRPYLALGVGLWSLALVAVSVMVAIDPAKRAVTPVFHLAAERWWAHGQLYADVRGFHYLPQFALLFAPFHALPVPVGDILWRCLSVALVLWGIAGFVRQARPRHPDRFFFFSCLLALAPCLGAIRNGQTNLAFAGLCVLLAALLAASRWRSAAACLVVLVVVKPLGLVLLLLAPWVYRELIKPLAVGLAILAVFPFLFAGPGYVIAQYRSAGEHFATWSTTTESRFADLTALLRIAGAPLGATVAFAIRAVAAVATLVLWLVAARRTSEPWKALTLVLLGTIYLMLFNPMTEKNSYAIVAPAFAVSAVAWLSVDRDRRLGWFFAFVLVSIGIFPEIFGHLDHGFGLWWDPLVVTAAAGALVFRIGSGRPLFEVTEAT